MHVKTLAHKIENICRLIGIQSINKKKYEYRKGTTKRDKLYKSIS
jgi:hypothetical protein